MAMPDLTFEVREPTGLELGTYDIFMIRQKLYDGEFHAACEFRAGNDPWQPLPAHPAFAEVIWLSPESRREMKPQQQVIRRSKMAGWHIAGQKAQRAAVDRSGAIKLDESGRLQVEERGPARPKKTGLLGRFFGKK